MSNSHVPGRALAGKKSFVGTKLSYNFLLLFKMFFYKNKKFSIFGHITLNEHPARAEIELFVTECYFVMWLEVQVDQKVAKRQI